MRRTKEVKLGDALMAMLRLDGIETPLNEYRAVEAWYDINGKGISRYTTSVNVRGGIMYVQLSSPALRQELMMRRALLVQQINERVGAQVLQQIVIR